MFNVFYFDANNYPKFYLSFNVRTREIAQRYCDKFNRLYPYGKPYPNGKGFYKFSAATVVERSN